MMRLWRAYQRKLDREILWPELKAQAPTLDIAKAAFMAHAVHDTAWTRDFDRLELARLVDTLE